MPFFDCFFCFFFANICFGATCSVAQPHEPSPAENAYLHSNYEQAVTLYNELLAKQPNSPEITAALSNVLLRQQKFSEANDLVVKAMDANPQSAVLLAAAGFVQVRAGTPWTAAASAARALALDACNPRVHLLESELLRLNSMLKSAAQHLQARSRPKLASWSQRRHRRSYLLPC